MVQGLEKKRCHDLYLEMVQEAFYRFPIEVQIIAIQKPKMNHFHFQC